MFTSLLSFTLVYLPYFINFISTFGTKIFDIPIAFMSDYNLLTSSVTVGEYIAILCIVHLVVTLTATTVIFMLSMLLKNNIMTMIVTSGIILIPCLDAMELTDVRMVTAFQNNIWQTVVTVIVMVCLILTVISIVSVFVKFSNIKWRKKICQLKCVKFSLAGLDIDTTKYDVIDASQIELIARSRGYQGDKAGLDILGSDWGRIQGAGILRDLANIPGAGGVAAAGAGMGMGFGAAGAFGSIAQQVFAPAQNGFAPQQPTNPTQNAPSGRLTQKNSASVTPAVNAEDPMETLGKLKKLLDAGLIEQAEYDAKKTEILSRM